MTRREAVARATARLRAAGVPDAGGDVRRLIARHGGGVGPDEPIADPDALLADVEARARRRPMAQILGYRDFWTRRFRVTADVLDPRPETETLVAAALERPFERILDLGTGSGCILLSLLDEAPAATGLGADLSDAALTVAETNAIALGLAGRAAFTRSDWLDGIEGRFDLVVSNPPYVAEAEMAGLAPEVRDWEPRLALTPGGDGLGAYRTIAAGIGAHLAPGGRLLVEVGPGQAAPVAAILAGAGLVGAEIRQDLGGRDRVCIACRSENA